MDQQINDIIAACDYVKAVKRSNKTMYLSFDEWNVIAAQKHRETTHEQWQTGSPIDCGAHSMEDALAFASMMMAILRRADRIKIACQSLLVNTGPLVVASKGGASWRNSIFYPFMHMSLFGRGEVLRSVVDTPLYGTDEFECVPVVDDLVIYNEENGQLSVFVVNRSEHPIELSLDLREFEAVRVIDHLVMSHPDLNATNTAEAPNTVVPRSERLTTVSGGTAVSTLPPYSWNVLRLEA